MLNVAGSTFTWENLIVWAILGFVAGLIIHIIDRRDVYGGIVATTILGIIGAIVGGFIAHLFFGIGITGLNLTSLLIAVGGGLLVSIFQRMVTGERDRLATGSGVNRNVAYYSQIYPREYGASPGRVRTSQTSITPIQIQRFLIDVDYPATKSELIEAAEDSGAEDNVIYALEKIPNRTYTSPEGVNKAITDLDL